MDKRKSGFLSVGDLEGCIHYKIIKYEKIKFLVIALKDSIEIYAWAPKPYHKFMAFKVCTFKCYLSFLLKGLGIFVSDSNQNPWFSSYCNHNYNSLGQSGIPWLLQADRLSDFSRFFFFLRHFLITLKCIFLGFQYNTIPQTLITRRTVHLRFNIVKLSL